MKNGVIVCRVIILAFVIGSCNKETPPTIDSFTANPSTITRGNSSTLAWQTTGATDVTVDHGVGSVSEDDSRIVSPTSTTIYTITASNGSGSVMATCTVTVNEPVIQLAIDSFTASPGTITRGNSSTLSWQTTGATTVTIDQGVGSVSAGDSRIISPTSTTIYTITATNSSESVKGTCTVTVMEPEAELKAFFIGYDDYLPDNNERPENIGDMIAVRFTPSIYPFLLEKILINISYAGVGNPNSSFTVNIYDDGGGKPGQLVSSISPVSLGTTTSYYPWNAWVDLDVSSYNVSIESGDFYVAIESTVAFEPHVGFDMSEPIDDRTWIFRGGSWENAYTDYEDAMIRVVGKTSSSMGIGHLFYDDYLPDKNAYQQIIGDMIAVRFTPSSYPFLLEKIFFNIADFETNNPNAGLVLNIFNDGGGTPGQLLIGDVQVSLKPASQGLNWNAWVEVDVLSHHITIESGDFYVALQWTVSENPAIGVDLSEPFDDRTWIYEGGSWEKLSTAFGVSEEAMIHCWGH